MTKDDCKKWWPPYLDYQKLRTPKVQMKQIQWLAHGLHTLVFLKFMSLEQGCNLGSTIARHNGMKNPNIKKCALSSTPEAPCMDISLSIITTNSRIRSQGFTIKWLQGGLNSDIMTDFLQPSNSEISQFIIWHIKVRSPCQQIITWSDKYVLLGLLSNLVCKVLYMKALKYVCEFGTSINTIDF